uniref:Putative secreted protein n=1 Tax=Ixodes ricinus TaxID=34613 RepID=A0A6B0TY94_IXORI
MMLYVVAFTQLTVAYVSSEQQQQGGSMYLSVSVFRWLSSVLRNSSLVIGKLADLSANAFFNFSFRTRRRRTHSCSDLIFFLSAL